MPITRRTSTGDRKPPSRNAIPLLLIKQIGKDLDSPSDLENNTTSVTAIPEFRAERSRAVYRDYELACGLRANATPEYYLLFIQRARPYPKGPPAHPISRSRTAVIMFTKLGFNTLLLGAAITFLSPAYMLAAEHGSGGQGLFRRRTRFFRRVLFRPGEAVLTAARAIAVAGRVIRAAAVVLTAGRVIRAAVVVLTAARAIVADKTFPAGRVIPEAADMRAAGVAITGAMTAITTVIAGAAATTAAGMATTARLTITGTVRATTLTLVITPAIRLATTISGDVGCLTQAAMFQATNR